MIGRGEEGVGVGKDVNSIMYKCFFFFVYCSLPGFFCTSNIITKNGQVLNKPQMRLAKKSWRYLLQIQTDIHVCKCHKYHLVEGLTENSLSDKRAFFETGIKRPSTQGCGQWTIRAG